MNPEIAEYFEKFGATFSFELFLDIPEDRQENVLFMVNQAMKGERGAITNDDLSELPRNALI